MFDIDQMIVCIIPKVYTINLLEGRTPVKIQRGSENTLAIGRTAINKM
ncbi:hypothetical protein [uncultured Muribaculum sp.]|nr:hypothetical protein [uncultured Muribaculum sp.]